MARLIPASAKVTFMQKTYKVSLPKTFGVVELEVLEALDGLQWLKTGEEVSRRFGISQPTASRYAAKALATFGLEMHRVHGEWEIVGDQTFLRLEREVHQLARRLDYRPLRLEATYWTAPTLCNDLPNSWILGQSNIVGVERNFSLLQDRVVDAWIAGLPDLPTACKHPELTAIVLSRMPVFFTCSPGHPLLDRDSIGYDDIAEFPTLALPDGSYPKVEAALKQINLWNDGVRMGRYRRDRWEGKSESDLVIGYGTSLSMKVNGGNLCRLPLRLPFDSGDALVLRKDLLAEPKVADLLAHLKENIKTLSAELPDIELLQ